MSELKARTARSIADEEEMLELGADCPIEPTQVYIKSEADKVIEELEESHKKEVEQLLIEIEELKEKHKTEVKELLNLIRDKENNFDRAFDSEEKEIRHHKYKRCLDKAEMCQARYDAEDAKVNGHYSSWEYISEEMKYWERWQRRWQELAERFKEEN